MAELVLDEFLGVGPDAVGVGEIGPPHDVVFAEDVDEADTKPTVAGKISSSATLVDVAGPSLVTTSV